MSRRDDERVADILEAAMEIGEVIALGRGTQDKDRIRQLAVERLLEITAYSPDLSVTTLHRRFRAEVGVTPLAWLNAERVNLARRLIEQGVEPLDLVAHRSGLGTTANLRAQMRRRTGLSPSQYSSRFAHD